MTMPDEESRELERERERQRRAEIGCTCPVHEWWPGAHWISGSCPFHHAPAPAAVAEGGRVFGDHEADAMFEAIASRLALAAPHVGLGADFLQELRDERRFLVARRIEVELALARLYDSLKAERPAAETGPLLGEAMQGARKALGGS